MTRMVFDGLTATILERTLAAQGWTLADMAASIATALTCRYGRVHLSQLKRDAEAADFVIGTGPDPLGLEVPGCDAFSAPGNARPMTGVPVMWGSVLRIDGRLELRPNAIVCHESVIAMPSRLKGRLLISDHQLPGTVTTGLGIATVGRPLSSVMSLESLDAIDLPIREVRDARVDDYRRIALHVDPGAVRSVPAQAVVGHGKAPPAIVITVEAGPVVTVEF